MCTLKHIQTIFKIIIICSLHVFGHGHVFFFFIRRKLWYRCQNTAVVHLRQTRDGFKTPAMPFDFSVISVRKLHIRCRRFWTSSHEFPPWWLVHKPLISGYTPVRYSFRERKRDGASANLFWRLTKCGYAFVKPLMCLCRDIRSRTEDIRLQLESNKANWKGFYKFELFFGIINERWQSTEKKLVALYIYFFLHLFAGLGWCLSASLMNNHVTQKWMLQVKAPWKYSLEQHSGWNRL